jgi:hypothetical protein
MERGRTSSSLAKMAKGWYSRRVEGEEERSEAITLTNAQILTWMAWQGSARTANQAWPRDDFIGGGTAAGPGAPNRGYFHRRCMATKITTTPPLAHAREVIVDGGFGDDKSRWISMPKMARISSERRRPTNLVGGRGRGR